jgi:hypothetical protein
MAGRLILDIVNPSLDANGNVIPGATLTFYENLTTTPQYVFTDSTLVTHLDNPLTSDDAGRFPPIWAESGVPYSVEWKDDNGITIETFDDITASGAEAITNVDTLADLRALDKPDSAEFVAVDDGDVYQWDTAATDSVVTGYVEQANAGGNGRWFKLTRGIEAVWRSLNNTISGINIFSGAVSFTSTVGLGASATATTPADADNDTSVATTAFVQGAIGHRVVRTYTANDTLVLTDRGKIIRADPSPSAAVSLTIPPSVFAFGDYMWLFNLTGDPVTVTRGAGVSLYLTSDATLTDANRAIAKNGMALLFKGQFGGENFYIVNLGQVT